MDQPDPQTIPVWLLTVLGLAAWGCLVVWAVLVERWRQGFTVLPYEPRRRVPWGGLDLLAVLAVYLTTQVGMLLLIQAWLGPELTRPPAMYDVEKSNAAHMATRLIAESDLRVLLFCGLAVVVVAPIVEEFLYRVLLQGWLEAAQRRSRRAMPTLRRWVPGPFGPVLLSSFLFARVHFRVAGPAMNLHYLTLLLAGNTVANLLTMGLAIGLLRVRVKATAADLGWVPKKFFVDLRLGLVAFVAIAAPIYAMQIGLVLLMPRYVAPDPFALFFLALALGSLYYRTHRIVPAIVVHMSVNATSLALVLLSAGK